MRKKQRSITEQRDWGGLRHWYDSPLGRLYAQAETVLLADLLPMLFGYHIITLGDPMGQDLLAASPIAHHCHMDFSDFTATPRLDLLAEPSQLPVAADCMDVVALPHVLEFVAEPHAVLREVERILIPEGHVLILGFNPVSLWGLRWLLGLRRGKSPWDARLLSVTRVRDWLALLGFETLAVHYCFYRPPLKHLPLLKKLAFLERLGARWWPFGGGGYVLLAKKRVSTLTPIKPHWRPRRRLLTEGLINHTLGKYRRD